MSSEKAINDFLAHYGSMNEEKYHKEFMSLKLQSQKNKEKNVYPAEAGQLPYNKKKNRFKDILPFEYTRVTLHPVEGVEGSDYINANYITGIGDDVTYIAAQGPLPNTVCDFWRMLWYHSIEIVVMACREVENAKPKCECYWPDKHSTREFSGISVTTTAEENKSNDFVVRDFLVECGGEQQYIRQYHYTAWPDHGRPSSSEPIVKMLEMVHDHRQRVDIPLLFHCSAGCGRTGTMIAIDIARTMLSTKNLPDKFSVHSLVERMRTQRPSMVQAKDQYHFVYDAVSELARRALGFKPTLPEKPAPSTKVISDNSDGVYQNTSPSPLPPTPEPPSNEEEKTTTHSYVNTSAAANRPSVSPVQTPSPPVGRRPVVREKSNNSSVSLEPSQEATYGNVTGTTELPVPPPKPGTVSPVPSPKPRTRGLRGQRKDLPQPPSLSPKPIRSKAQVETTTPTKQQPPPPLLHKPKPSPSPSIPPRTSTPVKSDEQSSSSQGEYTTVNMAMITDTGPEIEVLDERTGKKAPLNAVEEQLNKTGQMEVSRSGSSIMDTFLSLLGDDVINEAESREQADGSPSPPPVGRRTMSMLSEAPPAIPTRTEASYHLVDSVSEQDEELGEGYDMVRKDQQDTGGVLDYEMVQAGPLPGKDAPPTVYEAPTPLSKKVNDSSSPLPLPSSRPPTKSTSMELLQPAAGSVTLPAPVGSKSPRNNSTRSKISKMFTKTLNRDKKKPGGDIGAPVSVVKGTGMPRSPSDQLSSSSSSSRPSPSHSTSSANSRYNFPGELGFGIRICKPIGPRQEPNGWKVRALTNSVA